MARLVPFSLQSNAIVEIRGRRFRCAQASPEGASAMLLSIDGGANIEVGRNELASMLVTEEARICDELEEPDPAPMRSCTDLSKLSIVRQLDWQVKIFICRYLMRLGGASPKSSRYRNDLETATSFINELFENAALSFKWSPWTIYHDNLRWRAKGYDLAAMQKKGVEYSPWSDDSKAKVRMVKAMIEEILTKNPNLGAAALYREVNAKLAENQKISHE